MQSPRTRMLITNSILIATLESRPHTTPAPSSASVAENAMWNSMPSAKPEVLTSSASAWMIARVRWFFHVVTASVASVSATASSPTMTPMTTVTSCFTTVYGLMLAPPQAPRINQTALMHASFQAPSLLLQTLSMTAPVNATGSCSRSVCTITLLQAQDRNTVHSKPCQPPPLANPCRMLTLPRPALA